MGIKAKVKKTLDDIIKEYSIPKKDKYLDITLEKCGLECISEYEEAVELWITYGGD